MILQQENNKQCYTLSLTNVTMIKNSRFNFDFIKLREYACDFFKMRE